MAAPLDEVLRVRAPGLLLEQLDEAAARLMIDRSDYVRIALVDRLRADGMGDVVTVASQARGDLT